MKERKDKAPENKSPMAGNQEGQTQITNQATRHFKDNRSETTQLKQLQGMANNSPYVKQLNAYHGMANEPSQNKPIAQLHKNTSSLLGNNSLAPIQAMADMTTRKNNKKKLKKVLKMLNAAKDARGNAVATLGETNAHDEVLHSGQHHGLRGLHLNDLIGDLEAKWGQHTQNNERDSNLLGVEKKAGRGGGAVATQL